MIPSSTYRLQLHSGFTFADVLKIIPYLNQLGITTLYGSPIQQSVHNSMHGYDVTNPDKINPEIGTAEDLAIIASRLRANQQNWLQDIVPNHMSYTDSNLWLMDVFERGPESPFYNHFDIDWSIELEGETEKVMLPILTKPLQQSWEEISIRFGDDGFFIHVNDSALPLSISSIRFIAEHPDTDEITAVQLLKYAEHSVLMTDFAAWNAFRRSWFSSIVGTNRQRINNALSLFSVSSVECQKILGLQFFRLVEWQSTSATINYRRFFTINNLIGVRMEDETAFTKYHRLIKQLFDKKLIQGVRVDHIDGLAAPARYCHMLRKLLGDDAYVIVEKILAPNETIPPDWPVQGTTGYEFLGDTNQLFTSHEGEQKLKSVYEEFTGVGGNYQALVREKKWLILDGHMKGEWTNLCRQLDSLRNNAKKKSVAMHKALAEWMISMPVYRIYPDDNALSETDLATIRQSFSVATKLNADLKEELDDLQVLFTTQQDAEARSLLKRVMQFTGPLTAKGVEDTTFYVYNPLISHDEVGESPNRMSASIDYFHNRMIARQAAFPGSLNATSTHDTKRGEDTRLRLNAISEMAGEWKEFLERYKTETEEILSALETGSRPALNDLYLILQAIVGHFPPELIPDTGWAGRLKVFVEKALREGKEHSSWDAPDKQYEESCFLFIDKLLGSDFCRAQIIPLVGKLDQIAWANAASEMLLKVTCPGVPDVFQGCECWNHSFVDPDNRRPVDYARLQRMLNALEGEGDAAFRFAAAHRAEGYEKLFVLHASLRYRRKYPLLFETGVYIPIPVSGGRHVCFARKQDRHVIVILVACRTKSEQKAEFKIPGASGLSFTDIFTHAQYRSGDMLDANGILMRFPVAFLEGFEMETK